MNPTPAPCMWTTHGRGSRCPGWSSSEKKHVYLKTVLFYSMGRLDKEERFKKRKKNHFFFVITSSVIACKRDFIVLLSL